MDDLTYNVKLNTQLMARPLRLQEVCHEPDGGVQRLIRWLYVCVRRTDRQPTRLIRSMRRTARLAKTSQETRLRRRNLAMKERPETTKVRAP